MSKPIIFDGGFSDSEKCSVVQAAEDTHLMPFGGMELAVRMALLAAPQPADYELARLRKRVKELEVALNDQLNDCINFDGGKLTDVIMEKSTAILRKGDDSLRG